MIAAIYARVSTQDQDASLQRSELGAYCKRMGWESIEYVETASGKAGSKRPVLEKLMADARLKRFDAVLVWKLDRFGRSVMEFVERVQVLDTFGVRFIAMTQGIDTDRASPAGRLLMHILAAIAEFERELIKERVKAGVVDAQRRGVHCGRPRVILNLEKAQKLRDKGTSWRQMEKILKQPQATVRAALARRANCAA